MKATILHDEHGRIIAVSRIGDLKKSGSKFTHVGMIPGPGQRMLEIDLTQELEHRPVREIHEKYRVDLTTSKLTKTAERF